MDPINDDQTIQAMIGGTPSESMDFNQLHEYLGFEKTSEIGYMDDVGRINTGFEAEEPHFQYQQSLDVLFPGYNARLSSAALHYPMASGPVNVPTATQARHRLPMTPPDSDVPDSPEDQESMALLPERLQDLNTIHTQFRLAAASDFETLQNVPLHEQVADYPQYLLLESGSEVEPQRKRKRMFDSMSSDDSSYSKTSPTPSHRHRIKSEPDSDTDENTGLGMDCEDENTQSLKWHHYKPSSWAELYDGAHRRTPGVDYTVEADKGFNFSYPDDSFVCQKKNHFQITVNVRLPGIPKFVKAGETFEAIEKCRLHLYGIKMESPNSPIRVEQSRSDRSKHPYDPLNIAVNGEETSRLTVGRLHFSETTANNMRKKGKPNPDQRYFFLVVEVRVQTRKGNNYVLCASQSDKIIVRASNPGQFENDVDTVWSKGQTADSVFRMGRIGVNTCRPDEALSVYGNIKLTGHLNQPSDQRVKEQIREMDTEIQLRNVSKMRLYRYRFSKEFAEHAGLNEERDDAGVLAQEVQDVLPEAVKETNDVILPNGNKIEKLLVVNKDRIFMENVGAVKELCKLTDKLETRIAELERLNKKLQRRRADTGNSAFSIDSNITAHSRSSSVTMKKSDCSRKPEKKTEPFQPPRRQRGCHLRCRRNQCQCEGQAGFCTPRFLQMLIILLVFVMTLSAVAMATLYIMQQEVDDELSKEQYKYINGETEENLNDSVVSTIESLTLSTSLTELYSTLLPQSTKSPVVTTDVVIVTSDLSTTKKVTTPFNGKHSEQAVTTTPSKEPPKTQAPTTSIHPNDEYEKCCSSGQINTSIPSTRNNIYYKDQPNGGTKTSFNVRIIEKNYPLSCDICGSHNFTYYVPFSAKIPFQAITLQMNTTDKTKVLLCNTSLDSPCSDSSTHPPLDVDKNMDSSSNSHTWQLPIAYYVQSWYHFRVVSSQISADKNSPVTCTSVQSQGTSLFTDRFFRFLRVCEDL